MIPRLGDVARQWSAARAVVVVLVVVGALALAATWMRIILLSMLVLCADVYA